MALHLPSTHSPHLPTRLSHTNPSTNFTQRTCRSTTLGPHGAPHIPPVGQINLSTFTTPLPAIQPQPLSMVTHRAFAHICRQLTGPRMVTVVVRAVPRCRRSTRRRARSILGLHFGGRSTTPCTWVSASLLCTLVERGVDGVCANRVCRYRGGGGVRRGGRGALRRQEKTWCRGGGLSVCELTQRSSLRARNMHTYVEK